MMLTESQQYMQLTKADQNNDFQITIKTQQRKMSQMSFDRKKSEPNMKTSRINCILTSWNWNLPELRAISYLIINMSSCCQ